MTSENEVEGNYLMISAEESESAINVPELRVPMEFFFPLLLKTYVSILKSEVDRALLYFDGILSVINAGHCLLTSSIIQPDQPVFNGRCMSCVSVLVAI